MEGGSQLLRSRRLVSGRDNVVSPVGEGNAPEEAALVQRLKRELQLQQEETNRLREDINRLYDLLEATGRARADGRPRGTTRPGKYVGTESWEDYWVKFQRISRVNGWNEDEQEAELLAALEESPLAIVTALGLNPSVEEMVAALERR